MMKNKKSKPRGTALIFGTFDGVHVGHDNFFQQTREFARHLIAIIARDSQVREHKRKKPYFNERSRRAQVAAHVLVCHAYLGDKKSGEYKILHRVHPDIIVLGYDQHVLKKDLERWMKKTGTRIPLRIARAHKPHIYHTSFLTYPKRNY